MAKRAPTDTVAITESLDTLHLLRVSRFSRGDYHKFQRGDDKLWYLRDNAGNPVGLDKPLSMSASSLRIWTLNPYKANEEFDIPLEVKASELIGGFPDLRSTLCACFAYEGRDIRTEASFSGERTSMAIQESGLPSGLGAKVVNGIYVVVNSLPEAHGNGFMSQAEYTQRVEELAARSGVELEK